MLQDLQQRVTELEKHLEGMTSNWNLSMSSHTVTQGRLRAKEEQFELLSKELERVNYHAAELRGQLNLANKREEDLKQEIRELKNRYDELVDKLLDRVNVAG
ncbi:MAG: hypothetical protein HYX21_00455 [Candidatus Yanofskybacteria bacterium]|nr:hypothetical protein [Candidatus Yanofskybacteria bacterium]